MLPTAVLAASDADFEKFAELVSGASPEAALDALAERFAAEKKYPSLFEVRTLRKRLELGLPLVQTDRSMSMTPEQERAYQDCMLAAAREAGAHFLADGDLARAWPYFRAIGEHAPVLEAIERAQPGEGVEPVIEIAFLEGIHPVKGFELLLEHHGMCRAITVLEQNPPKSQRDECVRILVRRLHAEVFAKLRATIAANEPAEPEGETIASLVDGREWLFGEYAYYVDTSHLISVLRFSIDLDDEPSLRLASDLAVYGSCLAPMFQYKGDAPFEDLYRDHRVYLRALFGEDVDEAVAHFRSKLEAYDPEYTGSGPAQLFVDFLRRVGRFEEAVDASLRFLKDVPASELGCASAYQLCQLSGNAGRLQQIARERGDLLHFVAGALEQRRKSTN